MMQVYIKATGSFQFRIQPKDEYETSRINS